MSNSQTSKLKFEGIEAKETKTNKIIFVGTNKFQIKNAKKYAQNHKLSFHIYSEENWATIEEIDQYIQEEELSKQILTLPVGQNATSTLDKMESETIKKVLENTNGNKVKAALTLKIGRATLYRKIERYGLDLKKQKIQILEKTKFKTVA